MTEINRIQSAHRPCNYDLLWATEHHIEAVEAIETERVRVFGIEVFIRVARSGKLTRFILHCASLVCESANGTGRSFDESGAVN